MIDQMVNAIKDPHAIIVHAIVLDHIENGVFLKTINNLDRIECDHYATTRATADVLDTVGLQRNLHRRELRDEWELDMKAGFGHVRLESA